MTPGPDGVDLTGAILNRRWRVTGHLGAGGLAMVEEVVGLDGRGPFAAKVLRREFCDEPEVVARFLAEPQAVARIAHPGVVPIVESARAEDGTPYLVMERLVGEPLGVVMQRQRLGVDRAVAIARGVLEVLDVAHRAGVIHRDLKPDNVFLVPARTGQPSVRVLDFGVARVLDAAGGFARRTRTGMLLGTPGYMSPEQLRNSKDVDHRTDLWAVAVVLYEMLSGRPAFAGNSEAERMTQILAGAPCPIEVLAPQFAHWGPFFRRALALDREERFSSAAEMEAALLAAWRGQPLTTPPGSGTLVAPGSRPGGPGGGDTVVSPYGRPAGVHEIRTEPRVKVVVPGRRSVPLWVALVMSLGALLVGLLLGCLLGTR